MLLFGFSKPNEECVCVYPTVLDAVYCTFLGLRLAVGVRVRVDLQVEFVIFRFGFRSRDLGLSL